jgi:hypothetical protein
MQAYFLAKGGAMFAIMISAATLGGALSSTSDIANAVMTPDRTVERLTARVEKLKAKLEKATR